MSVKMTTLDATLRVAQEKLITPEAFQRIIDGDIEWLKKQPLTGEREHILMILRDAERLYYPEQ